jgi:hypothetical protein
MLCQGGRNKDIQLSQSNVGVKRWLQSGKSLVQPEIPLPAAALAANRGFCRQARNFLCPCIEPGCLAGERNGMPALKDILRSILVFLLVLYPVEHDCANLVLRGGGNAQSKVQSHSETRILRRLIALGGTSNGETALSVRSPALCAASEGLVY